MRTNILFHLALLIAMTGCTSIGPKKPAANPNATQTSWTDKVTAPFKSLTSKKKPTRAANNVPQPKDPISIGFGSGPATPALYVSMAEMSDQGGNIDHARAMYSKALTIDAKNLDARLGLARLEDREGNLQVALQAYQQAAKEHPEDARPLNDLALCHARCGQMQESLQLLDRAVRMKPEKELYRNNIAKVLIELNQTDAAVSHMAAVYEPAVANYNMAALLQERGRSAEAVPFLQAALAAKPQMAEANKLLANLTGQKTAAQTTANNGPVLSTPAPVSVPTWTPAGIASQVVNNGHLATNDDITPTPYTRVEAEAASYTYPSTGAPPMIPKPQAIPAQTALAPVGYEPTLFPPIR